MNTMSELDGYLNEGEKLLYTAEGEAEYLGFTDSRVIYLGVKGLFSQEKQFKDVEYSHISSVAFSFTGNLWMLIAGIVLCAFGLIIALEEDIGILLLMPGLVLVVLYFFSRKATIIFVTEQEKIPFRLKGAEALDMATTISKIVREYDK